MLNKDEYQRSVWLKFRYCMHIGRRQSL